MPSILTILIVISAIGLLLFTRLRPDLVALMVLLALGLTGLVTPTESFSGFSSTAVITILGISMISVALQQTGAASSLGRIIHKISGKSESLTILFVTLFSAILSLFMNNIAAAGILMPAVLALSRRSRIPPSHLLIPLAYGTLLGGMATLLTTANIIVSGALKQASLSGFNLLDFLPIGGPAALAGIVYLVLLGKKLLPQNDSQAAGSIMSLSDRLKEQYFHSQPFHRLRVLEESPSANCTIRQAAWESKTGIQIVSVFRGKKVIVHPAPELTILPGDILVITGTFDEPMLASLGLTEDFSTKLPGSDTSEIEPMAEVLITPHSSLLGKNLREIDMRNRFGLNVLGIWRQGQPVTENFAHLALQFGDALLVQGPATKMNLLHGNQEMMLLEEDPDAISRPAKIGLAVGITLITLTIAVLDLFPVPLVILTGAVLLMLTGCMSISDAFQRIEWKPIFFIAGMWPLTIAIQKTGLAENVIQFMVPHLSDLSPVWIVAAFLFVSMLLTQFISGPVAPIIIIPLALQTAQLLNVDPHPLAMAVALGCSIAFIFPMSHPVNIMVMNPGGYTFKDYFRVGFPLTILSFIIILGAIAAFWRL